MRTPPASAVPAAPVAGPGRNLRRLRSTGFVSWGECVKYFRARIFGRGTFPCRVPDAYPVFLNRALRALLPGFIRGLPKADLPCFTRADATYPGFLTVC